MADGEDDEDDELVRLDILGDNQRLVVDVRPEDSVWFAFMMLPPIAFRSSIKSKFQVWGLIVLPAIGLVVFNCLLQLCFLSYLYPIIEQSVCVEEGLVLTYACAIVLTFAVAGGEISDAVHVFEFLRLIPDVEGTLVFNAKKGKVVRGGIGPLWRFLIIFFCVVMRFLLALLVLQISIAYIAITEGPDDRIKDSVAFLILVEIDDIFFNKGCGSYWKSQLKKIPSLSLDINNDSLFHTVWNCIGLMLKPLLIMGWAKLSVDGFCATDTDFPQSLFPQKFYWWMLAVCFGGCCFARCTFVDGFFLTRVFFSQSIEPGASFMSYASEGVELETKAVGQPFIPDSFDERMARMQMDDVPSNASKLNHLLGPWYSDRHDYIDVFSMQSGVLYVAFDAEQSELHKIDIDEESVTVNGYKLVDTSSKKLVWHGTKLDMDDPEYKPILDELIWERRSARAPELPDLGSP